MRPSPPDWTIDEVWLAYQSLRALNERHTGIHARLCLHYAPIAKYVALRLAPLLHTTHSNPNLVAVAWIALSRAIADWTEPIEGTFKQPAIETIRDAVLARIDELNAT
jgi:DNA-directed RNA polymerase specialized sigma subunit